MKVNIVNQIKMREREREIEGEKARTLGSV